MARDVTLENLEKGVRASLVSGGEDMEAALERYLEGELGDVPSGERAALVERLALRFPAQAQGRVSPSNLDPEAVARLLSLLLGKDIPATLMEAGDAPEKFAHALNTVFDTLNRLVGVINTTFFGRRPELETIRQVIGSQIGDGEREREGDASLKSYLEQIQQAFLVAHSAFQESSREITGEILAELAPEACEAAVTSGLKIGPMRKAEAFEIYQRKYLACRRWLDSGGYTEKLLREFEKNCRKAGIMKED
jgi:hypothetical protein